MELGTAHCLLCWPAGLSRGHAIATSSLLPALALQLSRHATCSQLTCLPVYIPVAASFSASPRLLDASLAAAASPQICSRCARIQDRFGNYDESLQASAEAVLKYAMSRFPDNALLVLQHANFLRRVVSWAHVVVGQTVRVGSASGMLITERGADTGSTALQTRHARCRQQRCIDESELLRWAPCATPSHPLSSPLLLPRSVRRDNPGALSQILRAAKMPMNINLRMMYFWIDRDHKAFVQTQGYGSGERGEGWGWGRRGR